MFYDLHCTINVNVCEYFHSTGGCGKQERSDRIPPDTGRTGEGFRRQKRAGWEEREDTGGYFGHGSAPDTHHRHQEELPGSHHQRAETDEAEGSGKGNNQRKDVV